MVNRRGEKIGWTAGWLGGFIWVAGLSLVFLYQQKWLQGFVGILLFCAAVVSVIVLAPWRHPSTRYWKLMLGPYGLFLTSAVWAVCSYGGIHAAGLNWWTVLWLLPLFIVPVGSLGKRRWNDFETI